MIPEPGGSGATSRTTTAYCPWPPDCLTSRPVAVTGPASVSRSATRTGGRSTATPSRSSTTSACASPRHHSSSCPVAGSRSHPQRRVLGGDPRERLVEPVLVGPGTPRRRRPAAAAPAGPTAARAAGRRARTACRRSRRSSAGPRRTGRRPGRSPRCAARRRAASAARPPARRRRAPGGSRRVPTRARAGRPAASRRTRGRATAARGTGRRPCGRPPPRAGPRGRTTRAGADAPSGRVTAGRRPFQRRREAAHQQVEQLVGARARDSGATASTGCSRALATAFSRSVSSRSRSRSSPAEVALEQRLVLALGDHPLEQRGARRRQPLPLRRRSAPARRGRRACASCAAPDRTSMRPSSSGRCSGCTPSPNAAWQPATASSKSARGLSSWVTATARGSPTAAHSAHSCSLRASTSSAAETTNSAASAARRPARSSADEVRVARRVEQVDLAAVALERRERQRHRALLAALHLAAVAHGRAVLDPPRAGDDAGPDQQRLDQRRLARARAAHEHHVAHVVRRPRLRSGRPRPAPTVCCHGTPSRTGTGSAAPVRRAWPAGAVGTRGRAGRRYGRPATTSATLLRMPL